MLNRRIIRGKVLQQVFAYKMCQSANAELSKESIMQIFAPDLNSMEVQDTKKLEGLAKLTLVSFEEHLKGTSEVDLSEMPTEVKVAYAKALEAYKDANQKDKNRIAKKLVTDSEALYEQYILCILLLQEISLALKNVKKIDTVSNYSTLQHLIQNTEIQSTAIKHQLTWSGDQDIVSDLTIAASENEELYTLLKLPNTDLQTEKKVLLLLVKQVLFKNSAFHDFFEGKNIQWHEDKLAVKDMLIDTIQSIDEAGQVTLSSISKNWEDDKQFMVSLFETIVLHEQTFESYLIPKLQNWDMSRITLTDNILMKMCVGEILHFPNIPVKVSLNEYIEISKRFSTPKSKLLINGVLDALSLELQNQGKIKKSGRGLIDNK